MYLLEIEIMKEYLGAYMAVGGNADFSNSSAQIEYIFWVITHMGLAGWIYMLIPPCFRDTGDNLYEWIAWAVWLCIVYLVMKIIYMIGAWAKGKYDKIKMRHVIDTALIIPSMKNAKYITALSAKNGEMSIYNKTALAELKSVSDICIEFWLNSACTEYVTIAVFNIMNCKMEFIKDGNSVQMLNFSLGDKFKFDSLNKESVEYGLYQQLQRSLEKFNGIKKLEVKK